MLWFWKNWRRLEWVEYRLARLESDLAMALQVVGVVNKMLDHPEARRKLLEARKLSDAEAVIPELEDAA